MTAAKPGSAARLNAIVAEMEKAAEDYSSAKGEFDAANVRLEVARERFSAVRRIASELLSDDDLFLWMDVHEGVRFVAMPIGQAIVDALRSAAIVSAFAIQRKKATAFDPAKNIDEIIQALEVGGFEFRSPTPKREVNAALMKLEGVVKLDDDRYLSVDSYDILERVVGKDTAKAITAASQTTGDDEVPF